MSVSEHRLPLSLTRTGFSALNVGLRIQPTTWSVVCQTVDYRLCAMRL